MSKVRNDEGAAIPNAPAKEFEPLRGKSAPLPGGIPAKTRPWQPSESKAWGGVTKDASSDAPLKDFVFNAFGSKVGAERWSRLQELKREVGANATVVPLVISVDLQGGKRVEVPLFRVRGAGGERYLDDSGRTYAGFKQWKSENVLPPGVMTFPKNGEVTLDAHGKPHTESANTPLTVDTVMERIRDAGDTVAMVGGFAVGAAAIIGTGGVATPLVAAAAATLAGYGAARSGSALVDRANHQESLSLGNAEARAAWLGAAAGSLGLGALGATARVASTLARTGIPASSVSTTRAAQAMVAAQATGDAALVNAGNELWKNREHVTARELLETGAQAAMWGGFAVRAGGPTKLYSVRAYREHLTGVRPAQTEPINAQRKAEYDQAVATLRSKMVDAQGAYVSPLKPGYDPVVEEHAIGSALKGEKNHWSALHGLSTPELFARAQRVHARINPTDSALASRNTVELYDAIARGLVEQSALGRSLQTRLPPRLKDLYWNYADRLGTRDNHTSGSFNDFEPALKHLGNGRGFGHLISKELWSKFGTGAFFKEAVDTVTGRSPDAGLRMTGVAFAPILESPWRDGGYDASSHRVRAELGGETAFKNVVEKMNQPNHFERAVNAANGRPTEAPFLMLDFLGGHVSDQHAQFQAMLNGDKAARKYFNVLPPKTKVVGYETVDGKPHVLLQAEGKGTISAWMIFGHATQSNFRVDLIPVRDPKEVAHAAPSSILKLNEAQKQLAPFKKQANTSDAEALRNWRMDKSWDTRYQYVEVDGVLKEIVPTFHWFYDHQPSLNHQSTEVQSMMYRFLADSVNKGVSVFRADAAPHWGFRMPGAGEKLNLSTIDEHLALQENYKLFMMHVAPHAMVIPEVPTSIRESSANYGERIEGPSGRMTNSMADALLDFDSHRALWESVLDERKAPFIKHQREFAELGLDPSQKQLLMFMSHHDEMITSGFVNREQIESKLVARGALPFNGRGVGTGKTDALGGNAKQIAMSEVLMRASPGAVFTYQGALEAAKNDPSFMMQMKVRRQQIGAEDGRILSDEAATDSRDLARGNITVAMLEKARREGYEPLVAVRALNKLAESRPSIRGDSVTEIHNPDESVLTQARRSKAGDDSPHLWALNLSGKQKVVTMSLKDIRRELGWKTVSSRSLTDILAKEMTGTGRHPKISVEGDVVTLTIEPYDYMILERRS